VLQTNEIRDIGQGTRIEADNKPANGNENKVKKSCAKLKEHNGKGGKIPTNPTKHLSLSCVMSY